jgi:glycosyltransferase involved in cell wall biosynthesis
MLSICRILSRAGYEVRSLCTTAFDAPLPDAEEWHESIGLRMEMKKLGDCTRPVWNFISDGIAHNLVDTPGCNTAGWEDRCGGDFEKALDAILADFSPDVLFTYGGSPCFRRCRKKIRDKGAIVILGLRNHGYFEKTAMVDADYGLASSKWLAKKYTDFFGRAIAGLPSPLIEEEIVPKTREPVFYTFVNPSARKGALFFIRLAEELSIKRPDIPFLILDAQGLGALLVAIALEHGINLRRHENIMLAPKVAFPKDFLCATRAVIVPSLWEEPSARVAAEAQLCGIPAIVSDRGGLPETVGDAGIVLPIDKSIGADSKSLPPAKSVERWMETIERMTDDNAFYAKCCADATKAGLRYREKTVAAQYVRFFDGLVRKSE